MPKTEKPERFELEILKHVESTPLLNNRMAASKLGCSVKLAHTLLSKMVGRGLLHVKKLHARRWDYFLTPKGIAEKTRLTYDFIGFTMQFYHEARRESSRICRNISESGKKEIAFLGDGELAEIAYLGVKEWGLELKEVYGEEKREFLRHKVLPLNSVNDSSAKAIIVCLYDRAKPMRPDYLPDGLIKNDRMVWIFSGEYYDPNGVKRGDAILMDTKEKFESSGVRKF